MKRKLISLLALATLTLSPLAISGCKDKECTMPTENLTIEKKINPTLESDGIIVYKCPDCEKVSYSVIPNLTSYRYLVTLTPPSFDKNNNLTDGYYTYFNETFGTYKTSYDFAKEFRMNIYEDKNLGADIDKDETLLIDTISTTASYNFNPEGSVNKSHLINKIKEYTFDSYTQNADSSYTFFVNGNESKTYFLYNDSTYSTSLEEGKALVSSLNYGENIFATTTLTSGGYLIEYITLNLSSEGTNTLLESSLDYYFSNTQRNYYLFSGEETIIVYSLEDNNIASYEYLTVDYANYEITSIDSYNKEHLKKLKKSNYTLNAVNDSLLPSPSSYGQNVSIKLDKEGESFTLTIDNETFTIDFDDVKITQKLTGSDGVYREDYKLRLECTDETHPFCATIDLAQ